jgi:hypothetical protein
MCGRSVIERAADCDLERAADCELERAADCDLAEWMPRRQLSGWRGMQQCGIGIAWQIAWCGVVV